MFTSSLSQLKSLVVIVIYFSHLRQLNVKKKNHFNKVNNNKNRIKKKRFPPKPNLLPWKHCRTSGAAWKTLLVFLCLFLTTSEVCNHPGRPARQCSTSSSKRRPLWSRCLWGLRNILSSSRGATLCGHKTSDGRKKKKEEKRLPNKGGGFGGGLASELAADPHPC